MPTLNQISDLIYRRMNGVLKDDNIRYIYATIDENTTCLTFIIGGHVDISALMSITQRYIHTITAGTTGYKVLVLDTPNHFKKTDTTYPIWDSASGYVLPQFN